MASDEEILERMRSHPVGWRYTELARLLRRAGFVERVLKGSHRKWLHPAGGWLVLVDAKGEVKPAYVRATVKAIAAAKEGSPGRG